MMTLLQYKLEEASFRRSIQSACPYVKMYSPLENHDPRVMRDLLG
jgi:hypothetical protein